MLIPDHIWVLILKNLSVQKLVKLRAFSRHFYRLVEYVLRRHTGWGEFVKESIDREWLDGVMVKACPYDLMSLQNDNLHPLTWRKIYIYYTKWRSIPKNRHKVFTFNTPKKLGFVNMISTFGDYLLIGYEMYMIEVYSLSNNKLNPVTSINTENKYISQGEFWYCNGSILVVSVDNQSGLRFWDITANIELFNIDCYARRIHYDGCRDFCIGQLNGILTSFERDDDRILSGPKKNLELLEGEEVLRHTFHKNTVSVLIYRDREVRVSNYRVMIENGILIGFELVSIIIPLELNPVCLTKYSCYSFLNEDYIYVTSYFYGFATNYHKNDDYLWDSYVPEDFGPVMTMLMHARMIILGFEDGSINIISINSIRDMKKMTRSMKKITWSRKIRVANRPICNLAVWTVNEENHIVAITDKNIHLIKFA